MTPFPQIQRSCPHLDRLDAVIDAGFCRMCRRDVHDLGAMDGRERADFLAAGAGDACVSYTVNVKPALAAALIAASTAVLAAPDPALAANRHIGRSHQRPRPVPVELRQVPIRLAGMIAPAADPAPRQVPPPPPAEPLSPPQKPE